MIKPLLIAAKENARILTKPLRGLEHQMPRVQTGAGWSLRRFISADLKNYMAQTHIILDVSAFIEQDTEFIELLGELRQKHENAVVIIYYDGGAAGDLFLHQLIKAGFTNIVAGYPNISETDNQKLMLEDMVECLTSGLSPQKYERFILPEETDNETADNEDVNKPDYSGDFKTITVFGSQSRIGTTTFAMGLCRHIIEHNGNAALILFGENAEMERELMYKHLNGTDNGDFITVNGIDVFLYKDLSKIGDYNLVVFDCGNLQENADQIEDFTDVDALYLCCGVNWKELHHTAVTHRYLAGLTYTAVVMGGDTETCETHRAELCGNLNDYRVFNGDYGEFLTY